MKYNTISGSSLSADGKKSTLTIYADLDIVDKTKNTAMESEVTRLKEELLQAQTALDRQTRRCRKLVGEFTRRLQEKEALYKYEKDLRDDQLSKVLRALLLVEARLKQEQKLLTDQLREKDFIIQKQNYDFKKLLSSQYCKNCSHLYNSSPNLESLDSSSEYIITEYQESNFGSLDSSSEQYTTMSDKDSSSTKSNNFDDSGSNEFKADLVVSSRFKKNKGKDSLERRIKKVSHRRSVGTYFEVLKLRSDNASPYSNEDNTSNDYDNFDSLPPESVTDRLSLMSRESENSYNFEQIENTDTMSIKEHDLEGTNTVSLSESNITVIQNKIEKNCAPEIENSVNDNQMDSKEELNNNRENKLSDSIPVFDVEGETNDKWYVSASDQEDEQQKNVYRNNPVLECVNQILLQNINDSLNSPPKTPNIERKLTKNKKVKFSDEEVLINEEQMLTEKNLRENEINNESHNYYETPIQKVPNFYETPQSIYSNDYEQILSRRGESPSLSSTTQDDIQKKNISDQNKSLHVIRKNKILRMPPALPPKPNNLVSKYKIQNNSTNLICDKSNDTMSLDSEPDYCSISELNLPVNKVISKKIVVAEINPIPSKESNLIKEDLEVPIAKSDPPQYDSINDEKMIMKTIEKVNIQVAKQTSISSDDLNSSILTPSKLCHDIPKLPQVSEIIIPEESDRENEEIITQDNYVKNNTQMMKTRSTAASRRPINIGSSVSSLIMGFNNRELQYELNKKTVVKSSPTKRLALPSFDSLPSIPSNNQSNNTRLQTQSQDDFNLIQNFEEFKLDDCEIEEYIVNLPDSEKHEDNEIIGENNPSHTKIEKCVQIPTEIPITTRKPPEEISVPNLNRRSLELLKQHLHKQKNETELNRAYQRSNEPTYEHFLECTGLSSKSILTPSRMTTNHKTVLKPKDVKYRSKTKSNYNTNNSGSNSIKYWSEPFI